MKWKVMAAVAAGLVVAIFGTVYYIAGTPQYSLYLMRRAALAGDRETFNQHFDVTQVVSHAVDRAVGGIPAGPRIMSKHATDSLIPAAGQIIRERLDDSLADPTSAPVLAMSIDSVSYVNDGAVVTLKNASDGSTTVITMTRMPNRQWKIVDLDLSKANVVFTLDEVRTRAASETPNFPRIPNLPGAPVPGGLTP
ncbi:MAG TPA: hypothetical protein PLF26_13670 [Blastocatellia bacterium]|nr:hypothetical protein [Blastocatellia bacterium]